MIKSTSYEYGVKPQFIFQLNLYPVNKSFILFFNINCVPFNLNFDHIYYVYLFFPTNQNKEILKEKCMAITRVFH